MPGHKMGKGIPPELLEDLAALDVTEIPGTDNLHYPEGVIDEAQMLAAKAFGADESFFLVNGSTCGIHAMIMAVCRPGDKLIVARDCHRSAITGMMLAGVDPVFIKPGFNPVFGIPTAIDPVELRMLLEANPHAAGVLITRPNYYGICANIREIAEIVHSAGMLLMVDEAHGAHLRFNPALPACAMEGGADICVQSAHKTLPAFTQGAYLHVKSGFVDRERLGYFLRALQTSSPSYIILSMLDIAREIMERYGRELLQELLAGIRCLKGDVSREWGFKFLGKDSNAGWEFDETRLTINTAACGLSGYDAGKLLRLKYNIQVEMADLNNIVCIATVADGVESLHMLRQGLDGINPGLKGKQLLTDILPNAFDIPARKIRLRNIPDTKGEKVTIDRAAGRVCRGMIVPYPPGIPLVCPGEIITREIAEYIYSIINAGGTVHGIENNLWLDVIE